MNGSITFDGSLVGDISGGGGGGGDEVIITPVVTSGTKIADVSVNGVEKDLYCPTPPAPTEVEVTPVQQSGTKIATIEVDGNEVDLYAPNPTQVNVTPVQQSGNKIATIGVNGVNTDLYAPDSSGDIYSTSERVVGVWIDGKPLYKKTLNITTDSNSFYYSCDDLDIDEVVNLYGYVKDTDDTYTIPINCYERSDFYSRVYFQNATSSIYIGTTGYYPNYVSWVITIEYTKSTDIPTNS